MCEGYNAVCGKKKEKFLGVETDGIYSNHCTQKN
jgi:hypothetical protein